MNIVANNVSKIYKTFGGRSVAALSNITFDVDPGGILSIVGPSGSGKSTLLNLVAGIERPSSGEVYIRSVKGEIKLGYVLQENALFPWLTVGKNLVYALSLRNNSKSYLDSKASELCEQLGLDVKGYIKKYPSELSGGEKRRVAIGMALALEPNVLLLDEPSSQLDYKSKWDIQELVQKISNEREMTAVCVTHDLEEAVFLGDRILVLEEGMVSKIMEVGIKRPRTRESRASEEFNRCRRELLGA